MTSPAAGTAADRPRRRLYTQLWFLVIVAIGLGIAFGLAFPEPAEKAKWLADAFIQLIQTITGPVIFVTVVLGVASIGDLSRAGGLALRALAYFFSMTVIALALGLIAGNLIKPGSGFEGQPSDVSRESAKSQIDEAGGDSGLVAFLQEDLLPDSLAGPFVENDILRILVIALLVAASVSFLRDRDRKRVVAVFEVLSRIIFGVIRLIMWTAPLGAFGGMAYTVSVFGSASLANLGLLMVTFWGTCAIFVFGVLGLVAQVVGLQHLPLRPAAARRAADHRRHVVLGDRPAAPAGQAGGGRAPRARRSAWSSRRATRSTSTGRAST